MFFITLVCLWSIWPKIMFLHRAVLNYFRLYSPYISNFFFIQVFEKNQVTYFVSSSCFQMWHFEFFWNLFRMNYFMTILVFPKLFVFVLFSYVARFRFSTWLLIILVSLPPRWSSSKGNHLIRDRRLFGDIVFNERSLHSMNLH